MIKVLKNWQEIGEAIKFLSRKCLPKYPAIEKNWDLYQLYTIIESMNRENKIVDLGCGERLWALRFLYALGYKNLYGIDLILSMRHRMRIWRKHSLKAPFHLYRGDITRTKLPSETFDLAVCISVIEHGVTLEKFLSEAHRILKREGVLFITTDYWEDEIHIDDTNRPLGLPWKIYSKKDIENFVKLSHDFGFSLYKDVPIPNCADRCVIWNNQEYTFLSIILKKVSR